MVTQASQGRSRGTPGQPLLGRLDGAAGDHGAGLRVPRDLAQAFRRSVEEDDVDRSVVGHQLPDLRAVEIEEARHLRRGHARVRRPRHRAPGAMQVVEVIGREVEAGAMP